MEGKKGAEPQGPPPDYAIGADGRIYLEGIDVTHIVNPAVLDKEPEDENKQSAPADPDNAEVEGEGEEPEKPKEKEEAEPEPEEKSPEKEKPAEPEAPAEPDKWKFNLKFRGKEESVEWAHDEVQHRLAKLRAFEENEREFWDKRREVEPYWNIVKSEWFKERLKEGYESGELKEPPRPPEPPATVQYEILKRQADPDYDNVLNALQTYALQLPPEAMRLIDGDPNVFLSEYDRFAKEVREKTVSPKEPEKKEPPKKTPEEIKKELERKESVKARAAVTKPGTTTEAPSAIKTWENKKRSLERAMRDPANAHRNLELTAQLLQHLDTKPT